HLRRAFSEFVEHYHLERNQQSNRLMTAVATPVNGNADPAALLSPDVLFGRLREHLDQNRWVQQRLPERASVAFDLLRLDATVRPRRAMRLALGLRDAGVQDPRA